MKKKMIVLIIWCILVIGCFAAARSFLSAVLLTGTAVVLLFCIVSVKKSSHTLQMELAMPGQIKQGKKKSGKLILTDNGAFPLFCIKCTVCCAYKATGADEKLASEKIADAPEHAENGTDIARQTFSCAVKSYQKQEIMVKINSARAGVVHVWLQELTVYDMFGLFSFSANVSGIEADVVVVPAAERTDNGETAQAEADEAGAETGETAQAEADEAGAVIKNTQRKSGGQRKSRGENHEQGTADLCKTAKR